MTKTNLYTLTTKYLALLKDLDATAASIAAELPTLRQQRGLSQYALADRIGVSKSEVGLIETGHRQPTEKFVKRLKRHLEAERYSDITSEPDDDGLYRWTVFESHPSNTGDEEVVADGRAPSVEQARQAAAAYL